MDVDVGATPVDLGAAFGTTRGILTRLRIQNRDANASIIVAQGATAPDPFTVTGARVRSGQWFEFDVFADATGSFGWWAWCNDGGTCPCYVTEGLRG